MAFLNHKPCGMKLVIDHINDNKFDNRLENLQITSVRYNTCKKQEKYSSKYKGVSFRKSDKKWVARIFIDGKIIYLGAFVNEYDAHLAYQKKCNCLDSDKLFQI
jgi:TATA-box binding protein (TBP) (component of TFIID and TFIIIB)